MVVFHESKRILTILLPPQGITSVACSPDGRFILTASVDHTIKKWVWGTWEEVVLPKLFYSMKTHNVLIGPQKATLSGHTNTVNRVAYSPDGSKIVSAGEDRNVCVW